MEPTPEAEFVPEALTEAEISKELIHEYCVWNNLI